ncbi:unnamed protein product [Vitrella brassicaformis CCMP3155]|uniref:3'-5' exonuclease domain-containing protein n=2 Tax=Vitrella brassicaformis TaxID=1169539 RepID=A0A0G4FAH7_VITBC|nr:unnamed protein product [Vitrella brassicaformis CCMP3155]|eukprot:CEM09985.1 unnamed protein product [Vitrella brassicaformis CCMP3155]
MTVRRRVSIVSDAEECCREVDDHLRGCDRVAMDCEGVMLGRFGRLCLVQLSTRERILVCDALKTGVVEALKPILSDPNIIKVCHDCREDSSALYHQHGVLLRSVFDTQVAYRLHLQRTRTDQGKGMAEGSSPYDEHGGSDSSAYAFDAPLAVPLKAFLDISTPPSREMKQRMSDDPTLWFRRPLGADLLRYAMEGVRHLIPLMDAMTRKGSSAAATGGAGGGGSDAQIDVDSVLSASQRYVDYRVLNSGFDRPADIATRGTNVQGVLVSRVPSKLLFKLNCGRQGVVSTLSAIKRFRDVQIGEVADCVVSNVSVDGNYVYLDRFDALHDYWSLKQRPKSHYRPTRQADEHETADPLLVPQVDPTDHDAHMHQDDGR